MIAEASIERCRSHVRKWFAAHMPGHMTFHDLEHTLTVTRTAKDLGQAMGLSVADLGVLEVAALFHDTGYAKTYEGHEEASARLQALQVQQQLGIQALSIANQQPQNLLSLFR